MQNPVPGLFRCLAYGQGSSRRGGVGVPSTYSDVQVLEEDKQCLPDQLELPSREIPINLPRQGKGKHCTFHRGLSCGDRQGWDSDKWGPWQQKCQHPPSQVEQTLPCHLLTGLERVSSTIEQTCTPNTLQTRGSSLLLFSHYKSYSREHKIIAVVATK